VFRGVTAINLDTKGRLAVPTRYRDELISSCAGQLVITINTEERCLRLYPLPEWEIIQEKIESLPSFNSDARRIQFLLLGHATDVELDSNGRLLLPTLLRDYAQVDKKAVLIGRGKKFELWSDGLWEAQRARYLDEVAQLTSIPDVLQSLVL
jgi:MraZ protein